MGVRIGMPVLKLSRGAEATKRKGDARKVAEEAGNERYSKDQDLDRSRSHLNEYAGFKSGKALADYWEAEAGAHKDALGRPLKSTAITGFSVIFKPDLESIQRMPEAERLRFVRDGMRVTADLLQEHGLQVDMTALHRDEMGEHGHVLGHDPEYKAGKKIDIRLYADLNRELPKRMRELGYDVEDLVAYDPEKVKVMDEDEKAEYKAELIERKKAKKHGRNSNAYKAEKLEQERTLLEQQKAEHEAKVKAELKQIEGQKEALKGRENALKASERDFMTERDDFCTERGKWRKQANTALQGLQKKISEVEELKKAYEDTPKGLNERFVAYARTIMFKDGKSVYDRFVEKERQEQEAEKRRKRALEDAKRFEERMKTDPEWAEIINSAVKSAVEGSDDDYDFGG